jgi:hypothetical protein
MRRPQGAAFHFRATNWQVLRWAGWVRLWRGFAGAPKQGGGIRPCFPTEKRLLKPAIPLGRFGAVLPDRGRHPERMAAILVLNIWKKPVAHWRLLGQQLGHSWSHFK